MFLFCLGLKPFKNTKIIGVGSTSSASETLLHLLSHVSGEWCLINPITAVPTTHLSAEGAIYFGQEQIPKEDWASITLQSAGKPIFHARDVVDAYGQPSFPFTGRIYAKKEQIRTALTGLTTEQKSDLVYLAKSLFELNASEPPRNIEQLPDLRHRAATSAVTLGLLS